MALDNEMIFNAMCVLAGPELVEKAIDGGVLTVDRAKQLFSSGTAGDCGVIEDAEVEGMAAIIVSIAQIAMDAAERTLMVSAAPGKGGAAPVIPQNSLLMGLILTRLVATDDMSVIVTAHKVCHDSECKACAMRAGAIAAHEGRFQQPIKH